MIHKKNGIIFNAYLLLIILVKLLFITFSIVEKYFILQNRQDEDIRKKMTFWKERTEFIFIFLVAFLCLYLFNPITNKGNVTIDNSTAFILFLYGIIILITADWNTYFKETPWFSNIQDIIGLS